mmetsp:Transcript_25040/g.78106  ORF Transcript_25040/g.78106 Transcript_25040/m.78106 type:complete len:291 (-) Transcript_25040:91-963(-)
MLALIALALTTAAARGSLENVFGPEIDSCAAPSVSEDDTWPLGIDDYGYGSYSYSYPPEDPPTPDAEETIYGYGLETIYAYEADEVPPTPEDAEETLYGYGEGPPPGQLGRRLEEDIPADRGFWWEDCDVFVGRPGARFWYRNWQPWPFTPAIKCWKGDGVFWGPPRMGFGKICYRTLEKVTAPWGNQDENSKMLYQCNTRGECWTCFLNPRVDAPPVGAEAEEAAAEAEAGITGYDTGSRGCPTVCIVARNCCPGPNPPENWVYPPITTKFHCYRGDYRHYGHIYPNTG